VTRRAVLVLLDPAAVSEPPPGVAPQRWRTALAEDVADLAGTLAGVDAGVVATAAETSWAAGLLWPDALVLTVAEVTPVHAFDAAGGYDEVAVLAADVPDLPALHVGKLFRALGRHTVAVAPADGGGAVAIAARLPLPPWVRAAAPTLGQCAVAGRPDVATTPGWHRLRVPADVHRLDPGLEGWEATRALLSGP
jgi:hypothetical protein